MKVYVKGKLGFTLAEVLITLGIIGVVAALTIPTLMKNYQEKVLNTSSQVFLSKFNNALRVMNTQGVLAGLGTTENFVTELSKHMKIIKICDNNNLNQCMGLKLATMIDFDNGGELIPGDASTALKTAQNMGLDWGTNVVGFVLASGQSALVAYNPNCVEDTYNNHFIAMSCVAGVYDVNGLSNPNTTNKDIRYYGSVSINGNAAMKFNGKLWSSPFFSTTPTYSVEMCGGVDNTPTKQDLESLSSHLTKDQYEIFLAASNASSAYIWAQRSNDSWQDCLQIFNGGDPRFGVSHRMSYCSGPSDGVHISVCKI